jgi:hypothetical protein
MKSIQKPNPFETKIFAKQTGIDARKWFMEKVRNLSLKEIKETKTSDLRYRGAPGDLIGRMCYFGYQAKHADKLPYWDRFPLTIMIDESATHFLGLNMHYIPANLRVALLKALMDVVTNERFDKSTKLKISYDILKGVSKYRYFKPCLKSYIKKNVKTSINIIRPAQWHMAIHLPSQKFVGAGTAEVWSDSKSIYSAR